MREAVLRVHIAYGSTITASAASSIAGIAMSCEKWSVTIIQNLLSFIAEMHSLEGDYTTPKENTYSPSDAFSP